jgi:tetratricopeptide (TPR) repeat protein
MGAAVAQAIGDVETVLADATETLAVAEDRGFSYWIAWATALKGWAIAAQGRREDGLLLLEDGLMQYHATGSELFVPHCRMLMADILARAGRWSETKDALDQAEAAAQRIQVRFILTELLWRRAEVLANCDEVDTALEWLEQAIALARKQGAAGIERLATAELDRLKRRMAS